MKRIYFLLVIFVIAVAGTYFFINSKKPDPLPVVNPIDVQPDLVDSSLIRKGRGHKIGNFSLLDQNGKTVTESVIEKKVFVAEYFFSTCGSICPIMNVQMQRIQEKFKGNAAFKMLSFTVDPETDKPSALKEYALRHHYQDGQWYFITGKKEDLYALARKSFFVLKPAEAENLGDAGNDFIHTNNFVLVDKRKQIRGYYDGTNPTEVDKLMVDIARLLKEQ